MANRIDLMRLYIRFCLGLVEFPFAWLAAGFIAIIDALWLPHAKMVIPFAPANFAYVILGFYVQALCRILLVADIPKLRRFKIALQRLALGAEYVALNIFVAGVMIVFSYLVCGWNLPLADVQLAHMDEVFGFNWPAAYAWSQQPILSIVLKCAYDSIILQAVLFALLFAAWGRVDRLREIFWITYIGLIVSILMSGFLPALGPASYYGADNITQQMRALYATLVTQIITVRAGTPITIHIHDLAGIVTFPSFHTFCAFRYIYGFRGTGWVFWLMAALNLLMLPSIPFYGNHYIADMTGGAGVFCLSLALERFLAGKKIS